MKKKIAIVSSSGNIGNYLYKKLKKNNKVIAIERSNKNYNFVCKDLSNYMLNYETFKLIKKGNSKIDAIIICSGKSSKNTDKLNDEKFINSFKSNFLSVSNTIESYQKVYNNKPTKIIVISSIAALRVINAPVEYSVSKSALNHYCKIKAKELAKYKINLNIISPGNILNKHNNWYLKMKINKRQVKSYIKRNVPLNTFCKPSEILALCDLLISNKGDFFQGSNIIMDGGQTL
tara:strand:+ start:10337 stop:11035 length:699 start_codon:yes stop_codon:yes gene_type:complete